MSISETNDPNVQWRLGKHLDLDGDASKSAILFLAFPLEREIEILQLLRDRFKISDKELNVRISLKDQEKYCLEFSSPDTTFADDNFLFTGQEFQLEVDDKGYFLRERNVYNASTIDVEISNTSSGRHWKERFHVSSPDIGSDIASGINKLSEQFRELGMPRGSRKDSGNPEDWNSDQNDLQASPLGGSPQSSSSNDSRDLYSAGSPGDRPRPNKDSGYSEEEYHRIRDVLYVQWRVGKYLDRDASKSAILFLAFPCASEKETLQLLQSRFEILDEKLKVAMKSQDRYCLEFSSPDTTIADDNFAITREKLQREVDEKGYLLRERNVNVAISSIDIKITSSANAARLWEGSFFFPNPREIVSNTATESNKMLAYSNDLSLTPSKRLSRELQKLKLSRDSGFSEEEQRRARSLSFGPSDRDDSLLATPLSEFKESSPEFDGHECSQSSSCCGGQDINDTQALPEMKL